MSKKRKRLTTKNTIPKPPVVRLCVIEGDCNGPFKIVTDFTTQKDRDLFDKLYLEWFHSPATKIWRIEAFIFWLAERHPKRVCLLWSDYERITKGKVVPATKEEWEAENN